MQVKFKNNQPSLVMHKTDVRTLKNAQYLLEFMERNLPEDSTTHTRAKCVAYSINELILEFGSAHLDEKGEIKRSERVKAEDASAPPDEPAVSEDEPPVDPDIPFGVGDGG